jgi:hypothetical protein
MMKESKFKRVQNAQGKVRRTFHFVLLLLAPLIATICLVSCVHVYWQWVLEKDLKGPKGIVESAEWGSKKSSKKKATIVESHEWTTKKKKIAMVNSHWGGYSRRCWLVGVRRHD